ncbi:hypothetical protein ABBQ38_007023 [Trebouxia sp. C0009 RCD-2024]
MSALKAFAEAASFLCIYVRLGSYIGPAAASMLSNPDVYGTALQCSKVCLTNSQLHLPLTRQLLPCRTSMWKCQCSLLVLQCIQQASAWLYVTNSLHATPPCFSARYELRSATPHLRWGDQL